MRRPSPLPPPTPRAPQAKTDAPETLAPRTLAPPPHSAPASDSADQARGAVAIDLRAATAPTAAGSSVPTAAADADTQELYDAVARARELAPAPAVAPAPASDGDGTEALAPVVPLAPRADAGSAVWAETPDAAARDDASGPVVGVRDVMRAARARRKALRAEVRRFTARQRHRRMIWIGSAAAVLLLVLGTIGAAYSPLFAVERVTVEGTTALDAGEVETALASQVGTPLAAIDESAVKAALVAFPLVETYALEARPPHDLIVRIVERTPIGVIQSDAGYTLVDAAGVALSTTSQPPAGQPVIDVARGIGSPAFEALGHVMRSIPEAIRGQVTAVAATTPDDVTLTLGSGTSIVWGSAEDSAKKALVLDKTMAARPGAALYDVTSATSVVVR